MPGDNPNQGMMGQGDSYGDSYGPGRNRNPQEGSGDKNYVIPPKQKDLGTGPLKTNLKPSYYQDFKNKVYQNSLNRNRVLAMRKMNLMQGRNPFSKEIPDWAQDYTQEDLMQIATSGPYLGQQKTVGDVSKFSEGKDLLGRVTEGQSILDREGMTQTEWQNERLFPNVIEGNGNGEGSGTGYMGYPSYEAWLAAQSGAGTGEDVVEEDTIDYRFGTGQEIGDDVRIGRYAANGGIMGLRARRAFGGIMDRVTGRRAYGLGSIFKSVKKAVSKVLKSPIGKAAILYAGGAYLGGSTMMGGAGNTFWERMANPSNLGNLFKNTKGRGIFDLGSGMIDPVTSDTSFMDKAIKFGKWGALGYGLSKTPLGEAKPNESLGGGGGRGERLKDSRGNEVSPSGIRTEIDDAYESGDPERIAAIQKYFPFLPPTAQHMPYKNYGEDGYRTTAAEGGLMNLGGMEKDYRAEGGFVPIGAKEKADDVPARLSVNEFVFTADAVRGAGGGDIDQGAEIMENVMKNLEAGGKISAETQGNTGAQEMFSVSERLGEVI